MNYHHIVTGTFRERPNRFIAHVEVDGRVETVHVKNTGRCRELLVPGAKVVLEISDNPARKTAMDLVGVYKPGIGLVNMDSQAPNRVVGEYLSGRPEITYVKPEYTYGDSRLDFYFEAQGRQCLMEVKGVTLERDGIAYFPDAPTQRGVKHMEELIRAAAQGYRCFLAFVIQMEGVDVVCPNRRTHPEFGETLDWAAASGVEIVCMGCRVTEDSLAIDRVRTGYPFL